MDTEKIRVPDLGDVDSVEIIEVNVAAGDSVESNQPLVVLESEKASMDVEAAHAGKVTAVHVQVGDQVGSDALLVEIEAQAGKKTTDTKPSTSKKKEDASSPSHVSKTSPSARAPSIESIVLPDAGDVDSVQVIEVVVAVGQEVARNEILLSVESEKASMDIEAVVAGKIKKIHVKEGDEVHSGDVLVDIESMQTAQKEHVVSKKTQPQTANKAVSPDTPAVSVPQTQTTPMPVGTDIYAGPATRKLAREFGINLRDVRGSGKHGRILKEDLQAYTRALIERGAAGTGLPALPEVDFETFGKTRREKLSKLEQAVGKNMYRNWVNLPHVTQFDNADITDLEHKRKQLKTEASKRSTKLTPLAFLLRACALTLKQHIKINASLLNDHQHIVYKAYVHVGMAVDTPAGLVVPVVRDADQKDIWQLASEIGELAEKARTRKLKPQDMQGGGFTISSLGGIGGTGFTPIINAPEVAILGVSKMYVGPHWDGKKFIPRSFLPLSLSYDHRVINGGDAGRFMTELATLLTKPDDILNLS